ncbi:MAG: 50S ribosomal protein L21 [Candidatus Dependentiae bacterium]|jgi:large subunit ribosomal protein L21
MMCLTEWGTFFFKRQVRITKTMANDTNVAQSYALFKTGGKQYQAVVGKTLAVEKLAGQAGDTVEFSDVLLRKHSDDNVEIGAPFLEGAIKASIVKQMRGPKIVVFRHKRRKKSRVRNGHRQPQTVVRFEST